MRNLIVAFVLLLPSLSGASLHAQTPSATPPVNPIGASAIWQPDAHTLAALKKDCRLSPAPNQNDCLAAEMEKSGAAPDATMFTRLNGNGAFMRDFRKVGRVDIAYVVYPLRANQNQGWLLVNGDPNIVDVDDQKLLPMDSLPKNPSYAALAKKYPKIDLWPGDRTGTKYPLATNRSTGGQSFIVEYFLHDGCAGCARLATARFSFDFDAEGKFLGAKLERVHPLSAQ